jgi:uncharacterized membrane protein
MMATRDPVILKEEFNDRFEKLMDEIVEEKKGDRFYFIAITFKKIGDTIEAPSVSELSEEEVLEAGFLDVVSAIARFGLAVLNKKKDPFARIEEAKRLSVRMMKRLEAEKALKQTGT